jgi:glycosyltransferase involved in cell wall biosynthesis
MTDPLLLDLSHTCHTRARTGVQRVARSLRAALGSGAVTITHDPHRRIWRTLEVWERANLDHPGGARGRGARWPLARRWQANLRRLFGAKAPPLPANAGVVVPEIFSPAVAAALPELFATTGGPRVAVFHDAIALRLPELTPAGTVARFPAYLQELLAFDGIAAVSADSRDALLEYWRWLGLSRTPPVRAIPLGTDFTPLPPARAPEVACDLPTVLCVGSIEGRKNHLALLEAAESLWARGHRFELRLIGLAQPATGAAALARIEELRAAGRPVRHDGPADDMTVAAAYAACTFTVYPSLAEGFGLPVLESVAHGKPCVCSSRGALGEAAAGGGCLTLSAVTATELAGGIGRLLAEPAALAELSAQARRRPIRTWRDHAAELTAWIAELRAARR